MWKPKVGFWFGALDEGHPKSTMANPKLHRYSCTSPLYVLFQRDWYSVCVAAGGIRGKDPDATSKDILTKSTKFCSRAEGTSPSLFTLLEPHTTCLARCAWLEQAIIELQPKACQRRVQWLTF